jgi:hypothetical protein
VDSSGAAWQEITVRKITHLVGLIAVSLVMGACQGRGLSGTSTTSPTVLNNSTDQWLGKWDGPEGTYVLLSKHENTYLIKIQSLDGPANYEGVLFGTPFNSSAMATSNPSTQAAGLTPE